MVVATPRWWKWVIGAMCVPVVVLAIVFVIVGRHGDAAVDAGARDAVVSAKPLPIESKTVFETPPVLAEAPATPAPESRADARGRDEIQACGGAWVKVQADGAMDRDDLRHANSLAARERVLGALRADSSELAQAASVWLGALGTETAAAAVRESAASSAREVGASTARDSSAFPGARDTLARLAASSNDPRVYALAFNACATNARADGACQMLSADQWARLDPANASPWLVLLVGARARGDRAAQDEALHRIATAQRSDTGLYVVSGLIANAAPADDASAFAAWVLAAEAIGAQWSWAAPGRSVLMSMCRPDAVRDANRRQTCAEIADVLVERSDTLLERRLGATLGRAAGWSAERVDRIRGEGNAYAESTRAFDDGDQGLGCASVRRNLDLLRQYAISGEGGALRQWVADSHKQADEFVREERERQAEAAEGATDAASADPRSAAAASEPASGAVLTSR